MTTGCFSTSQTILTRTFYNFFISPPGTGKTGIIVSAVCSHLVESKHKGSSRRILVCGPTNKSITVLARRLLQCVRDSKVDVVIFGDKASVLAEDSSDFLNPHFVYTYTSTKIKQFNVLTNDFLARKINSDQFKEKTDHIISVLDRQIPDQFNYLTERAAKDLQQAVVAFESRANDDEKRKELIGSVRSAIKELTKQMKSWSEKDTVAELLDSADVVMCTLSSAGSLPVQRMSNVEDLIVDEAAAAIEPEVCIPLKKRPDRLLLVGDPVQLPATAFSTEAKRFGLERSLQERLMFDCRY